MSSIQNVSPEELVKLLHHYQEALAIDFGCQPGTSCVSSWEEISANERKLQIAAARLTLLELRGLSSQDTASQQYYATQRSGMGLLALRNPAATSERDRLHREYFAKPGEGEWGS
jgi:hypothetical protein